MNYTFNSGTLRLWLPPKILMIMRLIIVLLTTCLMQVSAATFAQKLTFSKKGASLEQIFAEIKKQTGYNVVYSSKQLDDRKTLDINFDNTALTVVLDILEKEQGLEYTIDNRNISIKKKEPSFLDKLMARIMAIDVHGKVLDSAGNALAGATVKIKGKSTQVNTSAAGEFYIANVEEDAVLVVSYVGYVTKEVKAEKEMGLIRLEMISAELNEVNVVSTGYQDIPKERATGSFSKIDNELFNRSVGTDVISRIGNVASGLQNYAIPDFNVRQTTQVGFYVRGQSTFNANRDPLVVLDNFPYEGNLGNLNPNDIESVTILKDAAAASIWGARSGNGVIVITTKKGKLNQPLKITFNSNVTLGEKPDLFYNPKFLNATDYINVETELFKRGYFDLDINRNTRPPISPVTDILAKRRSGAISSADSAMMINELKNFDVRRDYEKYVYRNTTAQQYALNLVSGTNLVTNRISLGFDKNLNSLVRNSNQRLTLGASNTYRPIKNLEIATSIQYARNKVFINNQEAYGRYTMDWGRYAGIYPYARLADEQGNYLSLVRGYNSNYLQSTVPLGFLDWKYRPLQEIDVADNQFSVNNLRLNASLKYQIFNGLSIDLQYQNEREIRQNRNLQNKDTYYTRNLINKFSVRNASTGAFTYPFPNDGILTLGEDELIANNFRGQFHYGKIIGKDHRLDGLAGAEIRETITNSFMRTSYGYNDEYGVAATGVNFANDLPINPRGTQRIAFPSSNVNGSTLRYISSYLNLGYSFKDKYYLSLSGRYDGSNIFGVKAEDKITPFWSVGAKWDINKEEFYNITWLPNLNFRATYGYNGNVYNGSAYLTARFNSVDLLTGAQSGELRTPPNPSLRWETVKTLNIAADFSTAKGILKGSVEFYQKKSTDLLTTIYLAPSTAFNSYEGNGGDFVTRGVDITISSNNIDAKIKWNTTLLFSSIENKITNFFVNYQGLNYLQVSSGIPVLGRSLNSIFSYKYGGLDNAGNPIGYLNGKASTDYAAITNNDNTNENTLLYNGSAMPYVFGALRNDFFLGRFGISVNITYKFNYVFRRESTALSYDQIIFNGMHDQDFKKAWKNPGDEKFTQVPAIIYPGNSNRETLYKYSESLIEKGDHIRIQDVQLSYTFDKLNQKTFPFRSLKFYGYINNIGLLWKANKSGLDPDNLVIKVPGTYAIGLTAEF